MCSRIDTPLLLGGTEALIECIAILNGWRFPPALCPQRFRHPPDRLPDNLMLIEAEQDKKKERQQLAVPPSLQRPVGTTASPLRLWCRFCNSEVTESHADQPCASLCSLKKPRSEEVNGSISRLFQSLGGKNGTKPPRAGGIPTNQSNFYLCPYGPFAVTWFCQNRPNQRDLF